LGVWPWIFEHFEGVLLRRAFLEAPRRTEASESDTRKLFCRSAAVLGRPRRTKPLELEYTVQLSLSR